MIVVKVFMWPGGDESKARLLSQATLALVGQAKADDPALGVRQGERAYRVRLLKDTAFGGPRDGLGPTELAGAPVWREGRVRGHMPGMRGVWDLLGGALNALLTDRLSPYRKV